MSWESFLNEKFKSNEYAKHKSDAKKDVLNALKYFPDLHPSEEVYVYNNGVRKSLVCITGTIPVNYKGSRYNIPVKVWLLPGHPYTPPLVYVSPTSTMVIKPGKHVDQAGRVYMPFITDWSYPKSTMGQLLNNLCLLFGQDCPVYSRSTVSTPYPVGQSQGLGYPTQNNRMPMPNMPIPFQQHSQQQTYSHQPYPNPGMTRSPYPQHNATPYPTPYPLSTNNYPVSTSNYPVSTSNYQPTKGMTGHTPARTDSVIDDKTIQASLVSSVEDKLKRRVKEVFQMGNMELEKLESTKQDLERGGTQLKEYMSMMENEKKALESNITLLKEKNDELNKNLQKIQENADNMNIDEAVVTNAPLYNQILDLFSEESAVDDAIFYLSDALRQEVINLDVFLKTVRALSRKQFMLRATLQKACETAQLS